jgi:ribonuclease HI
MSSLYRGLNTYIFFEGSTGIYKVKNYIIYDIYNIFTSLSNIGINVILEWIPSHVGILGNELADKEAKHSLSFKNIYVFNPLYKEDIKTLSRTFLS